MIPGRFDLFTSTAAVCVFDPEVLLHRLNDPADWWSDFMEEIDEVNAGNIMIVGLGTDGRYGTTIGANEQVSETENSVSSLIRNMSGKVFVGPGEEVLGGGYQPSTLRHRTGVFLNLEPSSYRVTIAKLAKDELVISLNSVSGGWTNSNEDQLFLED